jgi:16S rRNA G1207 methylase RsmC
MDVEELRNHTKAEVAELGSGAGPIGASTNSESRNGAVR